MSPHACLTFLVCGCTLQARPLPEHYPYHLQQGCWGAAPAHLTLPEKCGGGHRQAQHQRPGAASRLCGPLFCNHRILAGWRRSSGTAFLWQSFPFIPFPSRTASALGIPPLTVFPAPCHFVCRRGDLNGHICDLGSYRTNATPNTVCFRPRHQNALCPHPNSTLPLLTLFVQVEVILVDYESDPSLPQAIEQPPHSVFVQSTRPHNQTALCP